MQILIFKNSFRSQRQYRLIKRLKNDNSPVSDKMKGLNDNGITEGMVYSYALQSQ